MDTISAEKIKFGYEEQRIILNDLSINFKKGALYGIIGPNGCGKSTFLNLLGGILKTNFGKVAVDQTDLKTFSRIQIAKTIAYVQQFKSTNDFDFTVSEVIMMGRYAYIDRFVGESDEDKRITNTIINELHLETIKDRIFSQLSGGEQQKVLIARAIVQQSKIILLDEPTAHLDINYQLEFMELFKKFVLDGTIVILVLHDLNLAAQYCDKIILMNKGKIESFGTVEETITRESLFKVYGIDTIIRRNPYTKNLFITPLKKGMYIENEEIIQAQKKLNIHVFAGGGNATELLPLLKLFTTSLGVINILDSDYELATEFEYDVISEAPFSPISDRAIKLLRERLKQTQLVILTNVPFGNANVKNLEVLEEYQIPIYILEQTPIDMRDFTNGKATAIYQNLCKRDNVKMFTQISDLIQSIELVGVSKT
jgi:iron complex transport system ATP-binding protein